MRVAIVAVAFLLVPSLARAQSLGEAARLQAVKRTGEAPAARSFSDADLRSQLPLPEAAAATAPPAPSVEPATPEDAVRAQLEREEQARKAQEGRWRALVQQALAEIERCEAELDDCLLRGG